MPLRVALFGSPVFALPTLERLNREHQLVLLVSQPDKPAGRGLGLKPSAVTRRARELGIELLQPTKLRSDAVFLERLAAADLDVAVTAAYGRILPQAVLDTPRHGVLNVHASLLPSYRGAAPVQWAVIDGKRETGVTIMQTEAGLDTGPIRLQRKLLIGPHETAAELFPRLATLGAEALSASLELLAKGDLPSTPQDDAAATPAPLLVAADGYLRWGDSAGASYDRFRGVAAWPGTSFEHHGVRVKVTAMTPVEVGSELRAADSLPVPGTVRAVSGEDLIVSAGANGDDSDATALRLERLRPPGGKEMSAAAWANGRRIGTGEILG